MVFLFEVPGPVRREVAVADHGAEFEDGFGAGQAPAGTGDVEAVFDQVPAGTFDDPGGDRPSLREGGRVVQPGLMVAQVADGLIEAAAARVTDRVGPFGEFGDGLVEVA